MLKSQNVDSLWKVYTDIAKPDTNRLKALNKIAWSLNANNPDSAIILAKQVIRFAQKTNNNLYIAKAYHTMGGAYCNQSKFQQSIECYRNAINTNKLLGNKIELRLNYSGLGDVYYYNFDYSKSIEFYNKGILISRELNDKAYESYFYYNIGDVYIEYPNYPKALDCYFKGLKLAELANNAEEKQRCYRGIAGVFSSQHNYDKALNYCFKALSINVKIKSKGGISACYLKIANIYYYQKNFKNAEDYYLKKLKIDEELKDDSSIGNCFIGLANVYSDQLIYDKALDYYLKAVKIKEKFNDTNGMLVCYINTGNMYLVLNDFNTALVYQKKGLDLATRSNNLYYKSYAHEGLANAYAKQGNFKQAYTNYVEFKHLTDSIFNNENSELLSDQKTNFEVDKKENELNLKAEAEKDKLKALAKEEKKIQYIITFSVTGILMLVVLFSFFLYKRFKLTNKQKHIIEIKNKETEVQKHLIEEKHKEITDSINYAERIQRALLAGKKVLDENLHEYFILFKPKDVVSGDFYWASKMSSFKSSNDSLSNNDVFVLVTADSTGHGVPGAIMSILNIACLDKAITKGIKSPELILNETRRLIIENLKNDGTVEGGKDGMDASLLCFDLKNNILHCAAANNPIWIIRPAHSNTIDSNYEIFEIKPDRMPVGKHDRDTASFTLHEFNLQKGDVVYTLTDGFPDQFGGENGKKFKSKKLQTILTSIVHEPLLKQKQILNDTFDNWKGDLEQVDDVTIIGVKI